MTLTWLDDAERTLLEQLVRRCVTDEHVCGAFGQGSRLTGLLPAGSRSDLDVVVLWGDLRHARALADGSTLHDAAAGHRLEVRRGAPDGVDLDVMHTTQGAVLDDVDRIEAGTGWNTSEWPDPLFAVSGLATAVPLLDPNGWIETLRTRLATPAPAYSRAVATALDEAGPLYLAAIEEASLTRQHWLRGKLVTELMRLVYVQVFAAAGHYAPFPKHLPHWFARLGISDEVRRVERDVWEGPDQLAALRSLVALARS